MTNTGEFVPIPMPLPPLPKLNIPKQIEGWHEASPSSRIYRKDNAIADTPKIDLTPVDLDPPKVGNKPPTEEQVNGIKPLLWIGLITLGLLAVSFFQGTKTIST